MENLVKNCIAQSLANLPCQECPAPRKIESPHACAEPGTCRAERWCNSGDKHTQTHTHTLSLSLSDVSPPHVHPCCGPRGFFPRTKFPFGYHMWRRSRDPDPHRALWGGVVVCIRVRALSIGATRAAAGVSSSCGGTRRKSEVPLNTHSHVVVLRGLLLSSSLCLVGVFPVLCPGRKGGMGVHLQVCVCVCVCVCTGQRHCCLLHTNTLPQS